MMKMNAMVALAAFVCAAGLLQFVVPAAEAACTDAQLNACNWTELYNFPTTYSEFDYLCGKLNTLDTCISGLGCAMNDSAFPGFLTAVGMINATGYMCNSTRVKTVYVEKQACILGATIGNEQNRLLCNSTFPTTPNPTAAAMCAHETARMICLANVTAQSCGMEPAHLIASFHSKQWNPLFWFLYNCTLVVPCNMAAINSCLAVQPVLSATETKPWVAADFDYYCSRADNFTMCVNRLGCNSVDELFAQRELAVGIADASQYMCNNSVRPVFLANQKCAIASLKVAELQCRDQSFPVDSKNATMDDHCRYNSMMYKCIYMYVKNHCNEETARMIVDYNLKKYGPALVAKINCTLWSPYMTCVQQSLDRCDALKPDSPMNRTTNMTATDMDDFCNQSTRFSACVNVTSCAKSDGPMFTTFQQHIGARDGFDYICTDHPKQVFLQNQKCFRETMANAHLSCYNSTFSSGITTTSAELCGKYDSVFKCTFNTTKQTCLEEAARVSITLLVKNAEPMLNVTHGCSFNVTSYWAPPTVNSSPVSAAVASWLTIGFAAFLALTGGAAGRWLP